MSIRRSAGLLGANVLGTLFLLALLEGGARLLVPATSASPLEGEAVVRYRELLQPDPLLFWTLRPDAVLDGTRWTNGLGLRDSEIEPRREGELRILALGESSTFGDGVRVEDRYTEVLARQLPRLAGRALQTINAGVPGHSLFQGVAYLRQRGLMLQPDVVLLYFGYNDFLKVSYRAAREGVASGLSDRELYERRRRPLARALWTLERSSALARLALESGREGQVVRGRGVRVPEQDRRQLLRELRQLCAEEGLQLVVVIPWYLHFDLHIPLLRELRNEPDVVLVDLPWRLRDTPRTDYFLDTLHPNAKGHRLIAGEIAAVLQREGARFARPE